MKKLNSGNLLQKNQCEQSKQNIDKKEKALSVIRNII